MSFVRQRSVATFRVASLLGSALAILVGCSDNPGAGPGKSQTSSSGVKGAAGAGKAASGGGGARAASRKPNNQTGPDTNPDTACPVVVADADCDKSQRPFVFVHGTYGSGDNIANVALLFGSNGYCQDRFVAVEYNSLGDSPVSNGTLDALIDKVLKDTGADKVDLAGHSQGTGHCTNYLSDAAHAAKVAHYINLSGGSTVPNNIPTLSISSMNDLNGTPHHAPNAEKTVTLTDEDHFGVAASQKSFVAMWKYLHDDKDPQYTEIQCGEDPITIEGIAETFADNTPVQGGKLELYEVDASGDPRPSRTPLMTIDGGSDGHVGPIQLERLVQYEFRGIDGQGKVQGHVFFTPFKRSNRLARFLSPSQNPLVASLTTNMVVKGDKFSALVGRYMGGAFRHDLGNSLKFNAAEVLSDDNAGRTQITVGLFMSDQNMNGMSDLGVAFSQPFIVGTDVYVDAGQPAWIDVTWNGQAAMRIPNWPSASEGLLSLMLP
jgi:pimeloyl-ACP methyl ester carboxylesterase